MRFASFRLSVWCRCFAAALCVAPVSALAAEPVNYQIQLPQRLQASSAERVLQPSLVEAGNLLRVSQARAQFNVDGSGFACAVIDTGLRVTHQDFAGRIPVVRNFTTDDGGNPNIVTDNFINGTFAAGIVGANAIHTGFAPGASIIPLKILNDMGQSSEAILVAALDWVIANRTTHNITCVNLSLNVLGQNNANDAAFSSNPVRARIATLRGLRVPFVCGAGDQFFHVSSVQGMDFPAILRETISVGATYDTNVGRHELLGAIANTTGADRICVFSQRLHSSVNTAASTDIFAPGALLTSSFANSDTGTATLANTGFAAATVSGLVLLAQELHVRQFGVLPTVDTLENALISTFIAVDGDDEDDNVTNTGLTFRVTDAIDLLTDISNSPPPAGDITVTFNSGVLTLVGDALANNVTLNYTKTGVSVVPGVATTLNGATTPLSFTLGKKQKHRLSFQGAAGADQITINAAPLETCTVSLGAGADSCALNFSKPKQVDIDGGTEVDSFTSTGSKLPKKKTTVVNVP